MSDEALMKKLDQAAIRPDFILTHAADKSVRQDRTRLLYLLVSEDFKGNKETLIEDLNRAARIEIARSRMV